MDIHHLKVFASVYKNRSFTRATEELNLTQPTVSEHIKGLEAELGCRLFDRVGRRIIPTTEAEVLYSRALEIIEKLSSIKSDVGSMQGDIRGLLTVGASSTPGAYIVPPVAAAFRGVHPEVVFSMVVKSSRRIAELVANNELFLGIVGEKVERGGLGYEHLIHDELVLVARPGLIGKREVETNELLRVPFLLSGEESGLYKSMNRHHTERGVSLGGLNVVAVLGSSYSVKEAVKSGLGASILSRFAVRDDIKSGLIEEIRIKGARMMRSIYVVTHRKRTLPAQYRAFVDFLKEAIPSRKDPGGGHDGHPASIKRP